MPVPLPASREVDLVGSQKGRQSVQLLEGQVMPLLGHKRNTITPLWVFVLCIVVWLEPKQSLDTLFKQIGFWIDCL